MKNSSRHSTILTVISAFFIGLVGCLVPATAIQHGGHFSNLKGMLLLVNGTQLSGYVSYNGTSGLSSLQHRSLDGREKNTFSLDEIDRITTDDHDFVVRRIETPARARKEGKPPVQKVMLRRMSTENAPIQVFEYKYNVDNPKSSMPLTLTTTYAAFIPDDTAEILVEIGKENFKKQWHVYVGKLERKGSDLKVPDTSKELLDYLKEYQPSESNSPVAATK